MASEAQHIVIVDYHMGNLQSVANALAFLGAKVQIADQASGLRGADALVLPGVGAFGMAMANLRQGGLIEPLAEAVLKRRTPFLGICLGMQLIAETSEELGQFEGLGWIPGHVRRLTPGSSWRVPHVGWNTLTTVSEEPLFKGIEADAAFYFVHSYYFDCADQYLAATCEYDKPFAAAVQKDNIFATQFHPEKSQHSGLKLLRNFLNFAAANKHL